MGDGGIGAKTSFCLQFTSGVYVQGYDPTIEDSFKKQVVVDETCYMCLILDTCGQQEHYVLRAQYYKECTSLDTVLFMRIALNMWNFT